MSHFDKAMTAFEAIPYEKIEAMIYTDIEQAKEMVLAHGRVIEPKIRTIGTNTSRYRLTPEQKETLYGEWRKFLALINRVM